MKWAWVVCLLLAAAPAQGRYTVEAKVRYDTSQGVAEWQTTDVSFLTGQELVQLTRSLDFDGLKNYATIFFGRGDGGQPEIAVIRIDDPSLMLCGATFEKSCLPIFGHIKGPDQNGKLWEICTALLCL